MTVRDPTHSIEVQVTSIDQLFNSLDPFPFLERDLDKSAEEYIVGSAQELPSSAEIKIVIHLAAAQTEKWPERVVEESFRHYFDYRAAGVGRELHELFRVGRRSLSIGVAVLLVSVGLSEISQATFGHTGIMAIINEGLSPDDWVIVNGIQRVRDGIKVHPERLTSPGAKAPGESGPQNSKK